MQDKVIRLFFTPTHSQLADLLTKALSGQQLKALLSKMSIVTIHNPSTDQQGRKQFNKEEKKQRKEESN